MFWSIMVLVSSLALLLFYLQTVCERILGRPFEDPLPEPVVDANRLEFPFIRQALEEFDSPADHARFRVQLKCDYLALTYLLRSAGNEQARISRSERLLGIYFQTLYGLLSVCRLAGVEQRPALLKMTAVLEYYANVLGERIKRVHFGDLTASEYMMTL